MNFITDNLLPILTTLFGGGFSLAYVFERKKNQAITKGVEADAETKTIQNENLVIAQLQKAVEDLPRIAESRFREMEEVLQKKIALLEDENKHLEVVFKRRVKLLEDENRVKSRMILSLKKEIKERDVKIKLLEKKG